MKFPRNAMITAIGLLIFFFTLLFENLGWGAQTLFKYTYIAGALLVISGTILYLARKK